MARTPTRTPSRAPSRASSRAQHRLRARRHETLRWFRRKYSSLAPFARVNMDTIGTDGLAKRLRVSHATAESILDAWVAERVLRAVAKEKENIRALVITGEHSSVAALNGGHFDLWWMRHVVVASKTEGFAVRKRVYS